MDGPADAAWVEQFNTALDDSKRLCLASGETLTVPTTLNMIFEVRDLSQVRKLINFKVKIQLFIIKEV